MIKNSFVVSGGKTLEGSVKISGSKNSALACMVAASLCDEEILLKNVPDVEDIRVLRDILERMGKEIIFKDNMMNIKGRINAHIVPPELSKKIRGSMYLMSMLLIKQGEFEMEFPGGDQIGERPLDIHVEALGKLGAEIMEDHDLLKGFLKCKKADSLFLKFPSVGATGNVMIFAATIEKRVVIRNAAKEPEIVDLANLLMKMGVKIIGAGTDTILIDGVSKLKGGVIHEVIPDRIEASTFMIIAAITNSRIRLSNVIVHHVQALISLLLSIGIEVTIENDFIEIKKAKSNRIKGFSAVALPYPGIPTDIQPMLAVLAMFATSDSVLEDRVFEERFSYIEQLKEFGADIIHERNKICIKGNSILCPNRVVGNDIRSATALLCAAVAIQGESVVKGRTHLIRGYENFEIKLAEIGGEVNLC